MDEFLERGGGGGCYVEGTQRDDEAPNGATLKDCSSGHTFSLKMKRTTYLLDFLLGITFTSTFSNSPVLQRTARRTYQLQKPH